MANQYTNGWTEQEDFILREKASILSASEIGRLISRTEGAVWNRASRLGIALSGTSRKYNFNEHFFRRLTPVSAYWLGVIWADGHLSKDGVIIQVIASDATWLQILADDIETDSPLIFAKDRNAVKLSIYSVQMLRGLTSYGLQVGNRTEMSLLPTSIPNDLVSHFIRGLFDGDGCVACSNKARSCFQVSITNTDSLCHWILAKTQEKLSVGGGVYKRQSCNVSDWVIGGRKQIQKFVDWIYLDAQRYLQRKFDRFAELGFETASSESFTLVEERRPSKLAVSLA